MLLSTPEFIKVERWGSCSHLPVGYHLSLMMAPKYVRGCVQVSYMTNSKLWSEEDTEQTPQKFHPLRFLGL